MKNKFLVGVLAFFSAIIFSIIILNLFDSSSKKDYLFNRKFGANKILSFEKEYKKMNEDEYLRYIHSDTLIVEHDKKSFDSISNEYKFYFSDLKLSKIISKKCFLPKKSNVILCNLNNLFYTVGFKLFDYNFLTKRSKEIRMKNCKVFSLKSLPNSKTKLLCFGETFENGKYHTGFHILDVYTGELTASKILETNTESTMPRNALAYSGNFKISYDENIISYCCDRYSKIYFFNNKGEFSKELVTKDNVPLPTILTNNQGDCFYSRGGTWVTNLGVFIKNDIIYVFSGRTKDDSALVKGGSTIIIDQYSYQTLQYVKSHKLNYKKLNSRSVRNVFIDENKIILGFDFNYASFTFSRYI